MLGKRSWQLQQIRGPIWNPFFSFSFLLVPTKIGRYNSGGISMKLFLEFPFFSYFIGIGNNYFWKVDASYFYW